MKDKPTSLIVQYPSMKKRLNQTLRLLNVPVISSFMGSKKLERREYPIYIFIRAKYILDKFEIRTQGSEVALNYLNLETTDPITIPYIQHMYLLFRMCRETRVPIIQNTQSI